MKSEAKDKTPTQQLVAFQREAYVERRCKPNPVLAPVWDREAAKVLTLPRPPDIGAGGEVVDEQTKRGGMKRANIRDTLRDGATVIAEDASIHRTDLLTKTNFDCLALGIDAAESIQAENSIEKMLAHQMALAHELSFKFADKALGHVAGFHPDSIEANRCAGTVTKLMAAFQNAALALQKLRSGGTQTVTVQHVNVAAGGQAVVGNIRSAGGYLGR